MQAEDLKVSTGCEYSWQVVLSLDLAVPLLGVGRLVGSFELSLELSLLSLSELELE